MFILDYSGRCCKIELSEHFYSVGYFYLGKMDFYSLVVSVLRRRQEELIASTIKLF